MSGAGKIALRLPATSANLGAGFDSAAVAFDFFLDVEAEPASAYAIQSTGRDAERTSRIDGNLILGIYKRLLAEAGKPEQPIAIRMHNEIRLGMGCGSSAAGRLAAIVLANHFGNLGWDSDRILHEACVLEGHPDNAAACWLGGFVAAASREGREYIARVEPPSAWRAIVVLPPAPLPTSQARAVLPASYSRADVVSNLQSVSLLGLAFAQGNGELLRAAMTDRIHQPYREAICPLLPRLLPLSGSQGILGVALSGAGPSVLVIVESEDSVFPVSALIRNAVSDLPESELVVCRFQPIGARQRISC